MKGEDAKQIPNLDKFRCPGERDARLVARDLHQDVCQTLGAARAKLGCATESAHPELREKLEEVGDLIASSLSQVRSLASELHSPLLDELGLEAAVDWLCERMGEKHALNVTFTADDRPKPLEWQSRSVLFQVICELLWNVVRHAGATHLDVSVRRRANRVQIAVEDDGVGFRSSAIKNGLGLLRARRQIKDRGGRLTVKSQPRRGTRAIASLPVDRESKIL